MKPISCAWLATAAALAGCASAPPAERASTDAPVVAVAAAQSPSTSATLSSGLNTTTTDRVITSQTPAAPAPR